MAEDREEGSGSAGIRFCGCVFVAGAAFVGDDRVEFAAGCAGGLAAGVCGGLCAEEHGADADGAVWAYAESAVFGEHDDRFRVCMGSGELGDPGGAGGFVCSDLLAYDSRGRGLSAGEVCGV
jgi:hypothetical protein